MTLIIIHLNNFLTYNNSVNYIIILKKLLQQDFIEKDGATLSLYFVENNVKPSRDGRKRYFTLIFSER